MRQGRVAHDETERRQVIGRRDGVSVLEIDLVLTRRHFVVRGLDFEAHGLEVVDDHPAGLFSEVDGCEVEVSGTVVGDGRRSPRLVALEQEELGLDPGVHHVPEVRGALRDTLQAQARITGERGVVRIVHVADQPGDARLRVSPRKHPEGPRVGFQQHVAFLDPHESLDRRPVEQDLAVEGLAELARRNLDILRVAQDVRERQTHEAHAESATELEDPFGVR